MITIAKKLLPPNITIWWVPEDPTSTPPKPGIANVNAPTAAEINAGTNISCAMVADFTLGWTERDTDDSAGLCDDANVSNPLRKNYESTLTFFLDENRTDATSIYNKVQDLFQVPLQLGYLVQRIRSSPGSVSSPTVAVAGDEVTVFKFLSGDPNILNDPAAPIQMEVVFYAQGVSSNGIVTVV
jgi:hypothetical protein